MYSPIVCLPSFSPTSAHTVLTELVSAKVRSMSPKSSPPKLFSGTPEIFLPFLPLTRESGRVLARVERGGGGHRLHRRARRIARLRRAVDDRRVRLVGRELLELVARRRARWGRRTGLETIASTAPLEGSSATTAPLRPFSASIAACCALRVERRADRVADAALAQQRVDRADQLRAAAGQRVVAELLEAGAPDARERVADGVREQVLGRVAARRSAPRRSSRCAPAPCRRRSGSCRA